MKIKKTLFWFWIVLTVLAILMEVTTLQLLPFLIITCLLWAGVFLKKDIIVPSMFLSIMMMFGNLFIIETGASYPDVFVWSATLVGLWISNDKV